MNRFLNTVRSTVAIATLAALPLLSGTARAQDAKTITIGVVAKSQSNAVFQAAYQGAKDAAKELGSQYGVTVNIDWQTPAAEDAQKEALAVEALARSGAAGICVSCSEANTLTPAINKAVQQGVPVMTFDSDAPRSKRFAFYGTNDEECGKMIMRDVCKYMGEKGTVAILAGNQSAPNLQKRVNGAKEELANHPGVKLLEASGGVFYHVETPEKAAEAVANAENANPSITGWAMIGGWPLFTQNALPWAPGNVKVVACDALPAELAYIRDGHVQELVAQDCYGWGYNCVKTLLQKSVKHQSPPQKMIYDPLTVVSKDNVEQYAKNWDKWLGGR